MSETCLRTNLKTTKGPFSGVDRCTISTILTECVEFYTSMNIRYGAICEINAESQKITISDILI